jgi:hypothetical protein
MRRILCGAAAACLSACGEGTPAKVEPVPKIEPVSAPAPEKAASGPRYLGRWAANASECTTGWWRFWNDEVLTADRMRCDILPSDGAAGDERLRTVCQQGGVSGREDWELAYPDTQSMTVARDGGVAKTLVKC